MLYDFKEYTRWRIYVNRFLITLRTTSVEEVKIE